MKSNRKASSEVDRLRKAHSNGSLRDLAWPLKSSSETGPHAVMAVPLLILAFTAIVTLLKLGENILIPFFYAIFMMYLLRPLFRLFTMPFRDCRKTCMEPSRVFHTVRSEPHLSYYDEEGDDDDDQEQEGEAGRSEREQEHLLGQDIAREEHGLLMTAAGRSRDYSSLGEGNSSTGNRRNTPRKRKQSWLRLYRCRSLPLWLAMLVTISLAIGVLVGVGMLIVSTIQAFERENIQQYENRAIQLAHMVSNWVEEKFHVDASAFFNNILQDFTLSRLLTEFVGIVMNTSASILLVLIFMLYLMPTQKSGSLDEPTDLRTEIDAHIQRYLGLKAAISALAGMLIYFVLVGLNIPMAFLFAIFTFFFNFIPNVGALVAVLLPLPIVILDAGLSDTSRILAIALPIAIHGIVGNIIEPVVFGDSLELHPVTVLLSLAFWYTLWGAPGALLSVPITGVFRIVLIHLDDPYAKAIGDLLKGRVGVKSAPGSPETPPRRSNRRRSSSPRHPHIV